MVGDFDIPISACSLEGFRTRLVGGTVMAGWGSVGESESESTTCFLAVLGIEGKW